MTLSKKMYGLVHCHICPLKDRCEEGDAAISYKYHSQGRHEIFWSQIHHITLNCPLNKIMEKT